MARPNFNGVYSKQSRGAGKPLFNIIWQNNNKSIYETSYESRVDFIFMKICGWKNLKTMEIYVRLAGVNEAGATECLEILPMEVVMENVVSLYNN